MGRSKAKPCRSESAETSLLGRHSLDDPHVHLMMGVEIMEEEEKRPEPRPTDRRSQLEDLCDRIEKQAKKKPRKKRATKKKMTGKRVTFASATDTIGLPEIEILQTDEEVGTLIQCNGSSSIGDAVHEKLWELRVYDIPVSTYPNEFSVQTKLGAQDIWNWLGLEYADRLGRCVQEKFLVLKISNGRMIVSLTQRAVQVANAVPLSSRSVSVFGRDKPFYHLRWALAAMFPESEVSDLIQPLPRRETTAKEIYKWTDNVQLQTRSKAVSLEIDGLVPKLRPYQNAAVTWMLERERMQTSSTEWKLAWVVLGRPLVPLSVWDPDITHGLLYCPFTGWLAGSIEEARILTCGETLFKGGILADSMGLGKSVEVLACILANQYQPPTIDTSSSVRRRLDFEEMDQSIVIATTTTENEQTDFVDDMADFVDADDDSEDGCDTSNQELSPFVGSEACAVVTPDKKDTIMKERWLDVDIVGTCICGELIGFTTSDGPGPVVVCADCNEPMHARCAYLDTSDAVEQVTRHVRYMQRFTNIRKDCRVVDRSHCPCCIDAQESGATIIVSPPAILHQWEREVRRHTHVNGKPLRVVVYEGIKNVIQSKCINKLHPRYLANADIVLMSFDALKSDLGHTEDNSYLSRGDSMAEHTLRKRKRYRVVPSPLLSVHWWRVCLDEAQRIESPTAGSALMAVKLKAVHRWCVSGTPIGRGKLEDLFGLTLFLGMQPFADKQWFRKCFSSTYRNLDVRVKELLANAYWRSTKACDSVRLQMGVPEQIERKIVLKFSSVERHFYDRQLEQTLSTAGAVLEQNSRKRKAPSLLALSENLHRLRAACCHPQVGTSGIVSLKRSRTSRHTANHRDSGVNSRVMTMSQILSRLVDDTRNQCEEALRQVILHTNAMAALSKLKAEARQRGVVVKETDENLFEKSCSLYQESLRLAEEHAEATLVRCESSLSGSVGFRSANKVTKNGSFRMDYRWIGRDVSSTHVQLDFSAARKITQVKVRVLQHIPEDLVAESSENFAWHILRPKTCSVQCLVSGGDFATVQSFDVPRVSCPSEGFHVESGFRTKNKSKSWRIVVKSYYGSDEIADKIRSNPDTCGCYMGIDVEVFEPSIASDPLQRLHCLHNASISLSSLDQARRGGKKSIEKESLNCVDVRAMGSQAQEIESLYLVAARSIHVDHFSHLESASRHRRDEEQALFSLSKGANLVDCWDDNWWDDFLVFCHLHGNEKQQQTLCGRLVEELEGVMLGSVGPTDRTSVPFPHFSDLLGLRIALQMRIRDIRLGLGKKESRRKKLSSIDGIDGDNPVLTPREGRFKCLPGGHASSMHAILQMSADPDAGEVLENSHCSVCKADWLQTGPMCRHCKLGEELEDLSPDRVTLQVLRSIYSAVRSNFIGKLLKSPGAPPGLLQRASKFFDILEASKREMVLAWRCWRAHLDLLNDIDELNQCKCAMRLTYEGENVTELSADQLNAVVAPVDVHVRYYDHAAKQAMALGALSRAKGTLKYLKNQSVEEEEDTATENNGTCMICLTEFDTNRAVLKCGHSLCFECVAKRCSPHTKVSCPLRCKIQTERQDILIASKQSKDDGSTNKRRIKGSYGTKVTRLVSDVLDVCEAGDKSLVFSQWEDMLDICQQALSDNGVELVRVSRASEIGECTKVFRSPMCSVMLLNVKNGAEGLTLLEATNVFMIEPLLNHGLDTQAISRVHRIGQQRQTFVWRYLIADTIEMKIDRLRQKHQEDEVEDLIHEGTKSAFKAGGIDGGFQSQEELLDVLQS